MTEDKRKKKNFVSKKRVPHTRKKEKLKVLKLFKIGKDGSVEPQRQECPKCKGCFLAKHKDGRLKYNKNTVPTSVIVKGNIILKNTVK